MKRWFAGLFAGLLAGCDASPPPPQPPANADAVRFDPAGLPDTFEVFRAWKSHIRRLAADGAAMELREPGSRRYEPKDYNRVRNESRTREMSAAILQRIEAGNADGQMNEAEFAAWLAQLLPRSDIRVFWDNAAEFGNATTALLDSTLAVILLQSYGVAADETHERLWQRLADAPTGSQPWPRKTLPPTEQAQRISAATDGIVKRIKTAVEADWQAQIRRSDAAAAEIGRTLFAGQTDGQARRVGDAARIEAFLDAVRMPGLAAFYGRVWGEMRAGEIRLSADERAKHLGIAGNWDPTGEKRPKIVDLVTPRLNSLGADGYGTEELAPILAELLPDSETAWMAATWNTAEGQRAMPTLERLLIVHIMRTLRSQNVYLGDLPGAEEVAAQAEESLRRDAAGRRDPAVRRLQPYLEKSEGITGRALRLHADKVASAARLALEKEAGHVDPIIRTRPAL